MAAKLRAAGWVVIPPEQAAKTAGQSPPVDYVSYGERKPVSLPDSLDDLAGPTSGTVTLPRHIDWSGSPVRNLDERGGLETMYKTVLAEASSPDDLAQFIDRGTLIELWPTMWLPPKVRRLWEARFPELAATRNGREVA
ncbi:MAG: hypothetical protein QOI74_233 [Micromonosporaceae bacterium]|jgi:hypothetical protein|nr:hypothetical protein [Micromonosporaceae bacterium]